MIVEKISAISGIEIHGGDMNFKNISAFSVLFLFFSLHLNSLHAYCFNTTVVSVIDGDTIRIKKDDDTEPLVRLRAIDTPETHFMNQSQGYYADMASDYLATRLPEGASVTIDVGENVMETYGRILGRVIYNGVDLNHELIETGLAAIYIIYPFDYRTIEEDVRAAKNAVRNGLGMFDFENPIEDLPYIYRMKLKGHSPQRFVGNFDTKIYYPPCCHETIPVPVRIFFSLEDEAKEAGYIFSESCE